MSDALRARCDLDELEAKAKAASPGEWEVRKVGDGSDQSMIEPDIVMGTTDGVSIRRVDAAFIAAAQPRVVLELVRRLREARGIVRDLAAGTPDGPASTNCVLCLQFYSYGQTDHHLPTCPYRRAVDATRREEG